MSFKERMRKAGNTLREAWTSPEVVTQRERIKEEWHKGVAGTKQAWKEGKEKAAPEYRKVKSEAKGWFSGVMSGMREKAQKKEAVRRERHVVYQKEYEQEHLRLAKKKARIDARKTAFGGMFQKHTPKGTKISVGQSSNWLSGLAGLAGEPLVMSEKGTKERDRKSVV